MRSRDAPRQSGSWEGARSAAACEEAGNRVINQLVLKLFDPSEAPSSSCINRRAAWMRDRAMNAADCRTPKAV